MSDESTGSVVFPDEFDDPVLRRALENAPDAAVAPDWRIRRAIQQRAREAVEARDEDILLAPMVPLWKRVLGIGGESGRSRMPWKAAFAIVLVGVVVTALWQHKPVPEARLDGEAQLGAGSSSTPREPKAPSAREAANALLPEPVDTTPMPGLEPRNAAPALPAVDAPQDPSATSAAAPTPGTPTDTAATTPTPAPPAMPDPAPALPQTPSPERARDQKAAAADVEPQSRRAEVDEVAPPRSVLKLEPIPTSPSPPAASTPTPVKPVAPLPPPPSPAPSFAAPASPSAAAKSRDSSIADRQAGASPSAGAAAVALPGALGTAEAPPARVIKAAPASTVRTEATDPPTFAALSQWTRLTISQNGGETRSVSRAEGRELLPLIGSAAITAVGAQRFAGGVEWRLTFERDGKVLAVLELAREQVRWREGKAPPATGAPSAGSLAALARSLAEAVAPAPLPVLQQPTSSQPIESPPAAPASQADPAPPAASPAGSPPAATSAEATR